MTATRIEDEDLQLLKEAALHYLDQTSQLVLVKQKCENYISNKEASTTRINNQCMPNKLFKTKQACNCFWHFHHHHLINNLLLYKLLPSLSCTQEIIFEFALNCFYNEHTPTACVYVML